MKMPFNALFFHIAQISAIALAFVWFGWKGGVIAFLLSWATNTEKYTNA